MIFGHLNYLANDYWYLPTRTHFRLFSINKSAETGELVEKWCVVDSRNGWRTWWFLCQVSSTPCYLEDKLDKVLNAWKQLIDKQLRFEFSPDSEEYKGYIEIKDGMKYEV